MTSIQGGVFGSLMGTPIINLPQTGKSRSSFGKITDLSRLFLAVLGLHAIKEKPVAIDGKVEIRPVRLKSPYCKDIIKQLTCYADDVSSTYV